jgi:hypothetical protein
VVGEEQRQITVYLYESACLVDGVGDRLKVFSKVLLCLLSKGLYSEGDLPPFTRDFSAAVTEQKSARFRRQ